MFRYTTVIREIVLSLAIVMIEHLCSYRLCGGVENGNELGSCLQFECCSKCLFSLPSNFP
jgi:hypothetical protein